MSFRRHLDPHSTPSPQHSHIWTLKPTLPAELACGEKEKPSGADNLARSDPFLRPLSGSHGNGSITLRSSIKLNYAVSSLSSELRAGFIDQTVNVTFTATLCRLHFPSLQTVVPRSCSSVCSASGFIEKKQIALCLHLRPHSLNCLAEK